MTSPDVARSMAAHPSTQRPKLLHCLCPKTDRRMCDGEKRQPKNPALIDPDRPLCVVCDELEHMRCLRCGTVHPPRDWGPL